VSAMGGERTIGDAHWLVFNEAVFLYLK
jgi:hypothetical protein